MNIRLVLDKNGRVVMEARPSVRKRKRNDGQWSPTHSMQWQPIVSLHSIQTHTITVPLETMQSIQRQIAENGVVYFVLIDAQEIKK